MLKKPAKGKMPANASPPKAKVQWVKGSRCRKPPNRRMSMTSPIACITLPEARKSKALKHACVNRWNIAATTASSATLLTPAPRPMNI